MPHTLKRVHLVVFIVLPSATSKTCAVVFRTPETLDFASSSSVSSFYCFSFHSVSSCCCFSLLPLRFPLLVLQLLLMMRRKRAGKKCFVKKVITGSTEVITYLCTQYYVLSKISYVNIISKI